MTSFSCDSSSPVTDMLAWRRPDRPAAADLSRGGLQAQAEAVRKTVKFRKDNREILSEVKTRLHMVDGDSGRL